MLEVKHIEDIVSQIEVNRVTDFELDLAINSINCGKAADTYGLTIECIKYGGNNIKNEILKIINFIFEVGEVPNIIKIGLLTPVFKNKGNNKDVSNYRGITVIPVFEKNH